MFAFVVTPGFEDALAAEVTSWCSVEQTLAPGLVAGTPRADGGGPHDPVFARQLLPGASTVGGASVRALAEGCFAAFEAAVDAEAAAEGSFTLHAFTFADAAAATSVGTEDETLAVPTEGGLGSRVKLVGTEVLSLLQQRRRRAFRRFCPPETFTATKPPGLLLQIVALDRERLVVSAAKPRPLAKGGTDLAPWPAGVAPVETDRAPPSRAYQKLEETFRWMDAAPGAGDVCVDLGAAPGGWTLTALRRGARVIAVDRSPVDEPAASDKRLTMVTGNAFTFAPPHPVDWLLCDVICEPARTLALLQRWLAARWCRNLVATVKFKGRAGYGVLRDLPPLFSNAAPGFFRVKQLRHNKNEVTVMALNLL